MLSLTRAELRLTLVFAALLWFMTIFQGDFYLAVILTWAVTLYWKRWHEAHPGESVWNEPEPAAKESAEQKAADEAHA